MLKKIPVFFLLISNYVPLSGQSTRIKSLSIGDTIPDIELRTINYKADKIHLSDFKGKLLILDYWFTGCSVCIAQFPKLDSLQKQFDSRIFILPVGFDAYEKGSIEKFINKRKGTPKEIKLPIALQGIEDTLMRSIFPFESLPQEVWIDENGVVVAITDHLSVKADVIQDLINKKAVTLSVKKFDDKFNWQKPLLLYGNGGADSAFLFRSLLAPPNPAVNFGFVEIRDAKHTRIAISNQSAKYLMKKAFIKSQINLPPDLEYDPLDKRVVYKPVASFTSKSLHQRDNIMYAHSDSDKVERLFTYELILPPTYSLREAYKIMLQELEVYFKLDITIKKRKISCLQLVRTSAADKLRTTKKDKKEYYSEDDLEVAYTNCTLGMLVNYLNTFMRIPYIIDKTKYNNNIDIELHLRDFNSLSALRRELNKYDLNLIHSEYEMNMLVIQDLNSDN